MSLKLSHSQKPHSLLWASLQAACGKITMNGIPNHLNYCVIFTVLHNMYITVWGKAMANYP